jgi:poly(A) polymerase
MDTPQINNQLRDLAAFLAARGVRAWLVGGGPRDLLLGRPLSDLDLALDSDGVILARAYADACGGSFVPLDAERGTGRVVIASADSAPLTIDLVQLRATTIEADLALRDVTVNALALPLLAGEDLLLSDAKLPAALIDPLGGYADLLAGRLRACGPTSMVDDPLRTLRVVRLAATLGFQIEPGLDAALRAAAAGIAQVAAERVRDELLKLLDTPVAAYWLRYLDEVGVLTQIFPELEPARACEQPSAHSLPVLAHSLETVAALEWLIDGGGNATPSTVQRPPSLPAAVQAHPKLSRALPYAERIAEGLNERRGGGVRRAALLKLAALLHDNAKPQTKERHPDGTVSFHGHQDQGADVARVIGRRLRLGRGDVSYVEAMVREHMRPGQIRATGQLTRRAVLRLFRDAGEAGADVLLHELADHLATRGPLVNQASWQAHLDWVKLVLAAHYERPVAAPEPLLRGDALMAELGIRPGPQLGAILREIAEAHASGEIDTRDEALALARRLLEEAP